MLAKLAGHLPLQDMIAAQLQSARVKLAAAEDKKEEKSEKEDKKAPPFAKKEEAEKKASAIDFHSSEEVEKLAAALDEAADFLVKEADSIDNGGEKKQGGEQLPVQSPASGTQKQPSKGKATIPLTSPTTKGTSDSPGAEAMATDDKRAPGGNGAKYPEKGVLKTAAGSVKEMIEAKKKGHEAKESPAEEKKEEGKKDAPPFAKKDEKGEDDKEKKSAADFILSKIAEFKGGGEQTPTDEHTAPGYGSAKIPAEGAKLSNKDGIKNVTKPEAKAARKAELAQVLLEPATKRGVNEIVSGNLRSASKGGVKIAAAKALLQKIASEGCKCDGKGTCPHCKLKATVEKKKAEKK
jgi:hypothetical protein